MAMTDAEIAESRMNEIRRLRVIVREANACFSMLRKAYEGDVFDLRDKVAQVLERWEG